MNINAKQVNSIDVHNKMDVTTALGFFNQIDKLILANEQLRTALGDVWLAYRTAYSSFDQAYAQQRKWAQTADIEELDKQRDDALRAFLNALKAMLASPNAEKATRAKYLQNIRDKYSLNPGDEYMKETTAIAQMVQEMDVNYQCELALKATGLDDWYQDLKTKNAAFLPKMNERTAEQAYQQKGIVRETRLQAEAAYKDLVKLINAAAIMEVPEGVDYDYPIMQLNAEIEHYKQILARKGGKASDEPQPDDSSDDVKPEDGGQTDGGEQVNPDEGE